jgi:hypothetical protein
MGTRYFIQPIAPIEENTVRVTAGALTFGLEMRELNPAIVNDFYDNRPDEPAIRAIVDENGELEDSGPSIHVFGRTTAWSTCVSTASSRVRTTTTCIRTTSTRS